MTYNRKIMRLELSVENPFHGGHYYTELLLPAADYELKDAMQRVRAAGRENTVEFNIFKCDILPKLQNICLDTFSLDELNFFAKRLSSLTDEELPVFYAVTKQMFDDANEKPISIKDLINSTYGLDSVPVIYDVSNPTELGRYMLKHRLFEDADGTSQGAVSMLNAERLGEAQQKRDKGVFEDKLYIPTVHYKRPEVYGGVTLPDEESESGIFLLKVGAYPKSSFLTETPTLYDLHLPADSDKLFNAAEACGEPEINLCFCYEFYSSVPQITSDMFDSMDEIDALNMLAQCISAMSEAEQLKLKAVLESELTDSIQDALNIARNLQQYEFITEPHSADGFFKEYLSKNADVRFDRKWLDRLYAQHKGEQLLRRLGAALTDYGVVSARNGHLFKPVPYDEPETKELKTQGVIEKKMYVVEVLGRKALFTNRKPLPEQVPDGLYAYDLSYNDENCNFVSIGPKVVFDHGGTVLMKDILDFGKYGYIPLDNAEPKFLGETMTAAEFAEEETQDESMQPEGMGMSL